MNVFTTEKKVGKKSPPEPSKSSLSPLVSNSGLLGMYTDSLGAKKGKKQGGQGAIAGGFSAMSNDSAAPLGAPIKAKKHSKISAPRSMDKDQIVSRNKTTGKTTEFMSTKSRALHEMVQNATPEQLRTDTMLRKMILDDYRESMAARLQNYEGEDYQTMFSSVFRANGIGELETYNSLMKASLPEGMLEQMSQMNDGSQDSVDAAMDFAGQQLQQDPVMSEILMAGMDAFGQSKHFSGENLDRRSGMLMNNVMLRSIAPQFTQKAVDDRNAYADQGMSPDGDKKMHDDLFDEAVGNGIGKKDIKFSVDLQKAIREGGTSESGSRFRDLFSGFWKSKRPEQTLDFGSSAPGLGNYEDLGKFWFDNNTSKKRNVPSEREGLTEYLKDRFKDKSVYGNAISDNLQNASGSEYVAGLNLSRLIAALQGALGTGMSKEQVGDMYEKLLQGGHYADLRRSVTAMKTQLANVPGGSEKAAELQASIDKNQRELDSYTPQQVADMDAKMDEGKVQLKGIYYAQLTRLRDKYGIYGSQMHPDDFLTKVGPEFFDEMSLLQDCVQLMESSPKSFDFETSKEDMEFRSLSNYYNDLYGVMNMYATSGFNPTEGSGFKPTDMGMEFVESCNELKRMLKNEAGIIGPGMDDEQLNEYVDRLQKRMIRGGKVNRLFGRFKSK